MKDRWFRAVVTSMVLAAAAYLGAVLFVGRTEVITALKMVSSGTLICILLLSLVNYGLRFLRWHYYLRALGYRVPVSQDLRVYIGGFALTTTPGKVGELARTVWLKPLGVPATASVAVFMAERIQDLVAILLLSCLGLAAFPVGRWLVAVGVCLALIAFGILFAPATSKVLIRLTSGSRQRWIANLGQRVTQIIIAIRGCLNFRRALAGLIVGVAAWAAEGYGFIVLLDALGTSIPVGPAMSIYALSMLAGAVSFMPGGLGGSEATMVFLLRAWAVSATIAVSATVLIRSATLWFAVLLGLAALLFRGGPRLPEAKTSALAIDATKRI